MLEQFLNHINRFKLCQHTDRILLAVSGGIDSMVMMRLFKEGGFSIGVAHVNFQLRGRESNGDEMFVKTFCTENNIPFYTRNFETEKYGDEKGLSTQMAARELRYLFFDEVQQEYGYHLLATAHHLNDNLETVLLNLIKGTGLDGIVGIPVKNKKTIRPMLFATRQQLEEYATLHHVLWREDSSNASDKYQRNLLRHQVVPMLKKINPNLEGSWTDTLERIKGASNLVQSALQHFKAEAWREAENKVFIDVWKLKGADWPEVILWELIKDYGFNYDQCKAIVLVDHQSGKIFYSGTHQLTIDRNDLILSPKKEEVDFEIAIDKGIDNVETGSSRLTFTEVSKQDLTLDRSPSIAQLDLDTLQFPLTWRNWKSGDHFVPLGMTQSKKVSDFLVDAKVSLPEKEKVTVLISAGEIVWVVGYRVSERNKIAESTRNILKVKLS